MQIPKNVQQELVIFLQQGYSIDSVCKAMSKKYKGVELKKPDIIILSKRYNIKIGTKYLTKEKIDLNMAKNMTSTTNTSHMALVLMRLPTLLFLLFISGILLLSRRFSGRRRLKPWP